MKISEIVAEMKPARYTTSQAADQVGRSADTIKRWRDIGQYQPSDSAQFGKLIVPLYTRADIVIMRRLSRQLKPGPRKKACRI
jgi:hypothetical protein